MIKNNFLSTLILIHIFYIQCLFGMDEICKAPDDQKKSFTLQTYYKNALPGCLEAVIEDGKFSHWFQAGTYPHTSAVKAVALLPSGDVLVTGADDGIVRLWNLHKRKLITAMQHGSSVKSVLFNQEGTRLGAVSRAKAAVWDLEGRGIFTIPLLDGEISGFAFVPMQDKVALSARGGSTVELFSFDGERETVHNISGHQIVNFSYNVQGTKLAVAVRGKRIGVMVADLIHEKWTVFPQKGTGDVDLQFNPQDENVLMVASETAPGNKRFQTWDLENKEPIETEADYNLISAFLCYPNGRDCATISPDRKQVTLWQACREIILECDGAVNGLAMCSKGRVLATACENNTVVIWNRYKGLDLALVREILRQHVTKCKNMEIEPHIPADKDRLMPWLAETFNINQVELDLIWNTVPDKMKIGNLDWLVKFDLEESHDDTE